MVERRGGRGRDKGKRRGSTNDWERKAYTR